MSFELAEGYIDLTTNSSGIESAMARVRTKLQAVSAVMMQVSAHAKIMLAAGGAALGFMIKQGIDADETLSKFNIVFKEQAASAAQFAEDLAKSINRSKYDIMGYMASLQDLFVPFGFARDKAAELSEKVTILAEDLASFNNLKTADVLRDIQSALVGNAETVRKYGVVITEATLNQKLLSMGIAGGTKSATELQKVLARLAMITAGTSDAQGDAERTANSLANRLKGLSGTVHDLSVAVKHALDPALNAIAEKIDSVLRPVEKWVEGHKQLTANIIYTTGAVLAGVAAWPLYVAGVWMVEKAIIALRSAMIGLKVAMMFFTKHPAVALMTALAALAGYLIYTRIEGENFGEKMHTVAINIAAAWAWLTDKLLEFFAPVLPYWNAALAWIQKAFQYTVNVVKFTIKNFDDIITLGMLIALQRIVGFANDVKHWFTVVVPTYLLWFAKNWKDIFLDIWNATKTIILNIGANLKNFFVAIKDWISGKGWNFEWTGLLEGFQRTTEKLPDIAERQLTPFEEGLKKEIDRIGTDLGQKFADSMQKVPEVAKRAEKATEPAKKASEKASQAASSTAGKTDIRAEFVSASEMWKKMASSLVVKDVGKQQLAEAQKQTAEIKKTNQHLEKVARNTEKSGYGTVAP